MDLEKLRAYLSLEKPKLNVLTFNVRYDTSHDGENSWKHRERDFTEYISLFNASIIALQEPLEHQVKEIAENLEQYSWFGVGRIDGNRKGEFNPIFYKSDELELRDSGTFWLSETRDTPGSKVKGIKYPRICTWGFFHWRSKPVRKAKRVMTEFYALNTHLDHRSEWARSQQVKVIMDFVKEKIPDHMPVVLMGDLNCEEASEPYTLLSDSGILDDTRKIATSVFPAYTYIGFNGAMKQTIDHTWSRGFQVSMHSVMTDVRSNKRHYSDHRPVFCQLYPEQPELINS